MNKLRLFAILLAIIMLVTVPAFAEGGGLLIMGNPNSNTEEGGDKADYNMPEDPEDGKMYALDVNTTGADQSADNGAASGNENSSENIVDPADPTKEITEEELARRKEIYTMTALVALAAIAVGINEKRRRR